MPHQEAGLERSGSDLHYTVRVSPAEAVLGTKKTIDIPILGKKELTLKPGTPSGHEVIHRGEGLESLDHRGTGNLIIHIIVDIPIKISPDQKKLYEALLQSE